MNKKSTGIIYPIILKVPDEKQALSGKDSMRFLRQYARQAVISSAQKNGIDLTVLESDRNGAPVSSNGVYWSLSHKPGYVAGVISDNQIGIDIEPIRPVSRGVFDRVIDNDERHLADRLSDALFFRYWTAKEAVLKAAGVGLKGLSKCKIQRIIDATTLIIFFQQMHWTVEHAYLDNHVASVVRRGKDIQWIIPDSSH